jgi:RNA polymerase sigma-70 factor, ECF subfamily
MGRHANERGARIERTEINGQPGAMFLDPDGRLMWVLTLDIADGLVQTVRGVINPAKLRHFGPLADVRVIFRQETRRR